ncbi:molecular chaperone DnaJ [Sphingomonas sp. BIUV-7]|uniref:Molecular chaperone DnaJ n=1 Tax=Sphingomonas natans TaxID=3063330 RepID=A0ABT8Y6C5_9SPHN|nr:molecular chaperone DnaJ [Sphingomonas sp. BIUV-7]MDO6413856.1 molecular chaperone DnaJ [Sphingomonas sp. BIUV-7]
MMGLLLLAAAGIAYWAWKTRDWKTLRFGDVAAVVAALIGMRLFSRGEALPALVAIGGAGWWLWFRKRGGGAAESGMSTDRARALLDVGRGASAEEIRAAHRRLIQRVHPDVGGSAHLATEINQARDALLATDVKR